MVEFLVSCDWDVSGSFRSEGSRTKGRGDLELGEAVQQALVAASAFGRFQVRRKTSEGVTFLR